MADTDPLREMLAQIARSEADADASARAATADAATADASTTSAEPKTKASTSASTATTASSPVDVPVGLAPENRTQLDRLNDSLLRGDVGQREYDELVPFLLETEAASSSPTATAPSTGERPPPAPSTSSAYGILGAAADQGGLPLRCPSCGFANHTARGLRCAVCRSKLTATDDALARARIVQAQAPLPGLRPSGTEVFYTLTAPVGSFTADESGRTVVHDGFLVCEMQGFEEIEERGERGRPTGHRVTVFVLMCQWEPRSEVARHSGRATTWFVSQRFSNFETLDSAIRLRFKSSGVALPSFPSKYHWRAQTDRRRRDLAHYMRRLLAVCTARGELVPELDQFLTVSRQVEQFRRAYPALAPHVESRPPPASTDANASAEEQSVTPMDAQEVSQAEAASRLLAASVATAVAGVHATDVRFDPAVQHNLAAVVKLLPALHMSADVENPFVDVDLVPRVLQCQEDLERTVELYNDAVLARFAAAGVAASAQVPVTPPRRSQQLQHHAGPQLPALSAR